MIKIGNILTLLVVLWGMHGYASLEMRVLSLSGYSLTETVTNTPFLIELRAKDTQDSEKIVLEGLDQLSVLGQEQSTRCAFTNTSNSVEKIFTYRVQAPKAGKVKIGPARSEQSSLFSPAVEIEVRENSAKHYTDSKNTKDIYELIVDKKDIYREQKVDFILRLTSYESALHLDALEDPEVKGLKVAYLGKPLIHNKVHNGHMCTIVELKGYFYPEQAGQITIGPLGAHYRVPLKQQQEDQSFWALFFKPQHEKKRVYTKPLNLTISDLPHTGKVVNGIGRFTAFTASIAHEQLSQGEATVLTLTVEGDGNWEYSKTPALFLPSELKYYESKSNFTANGKMGCKSYEYILQAMSPALVHIAPQEFTYFDPEYKKYKTLTTDELTLEIVPSKAGDTNEKNNFKKEETFNSVIAQHQNEHNKYYEIPLSFFIALLLLPVMGKLSILVRKKLLNNRAQKRIIVKALKNVQKAAQENAIPGIYILVKQAMANYFSIDFNSVTDEIITAKLQESYSEKYSKEWQELSSLLLSYTEYAHIKHNPKDYSFLFKRAENFLKSFNKNTFFLILLFLSVSTSDITGKECSPELFTTILALRRLQKNATGKAIDAIEQSVQLLKEEHGITAQKRPRSWRDSLYIISSTIPFGVWQILFITLWWILIFFASLLAIRYNIVIVILFILTSSGTIMVAWGRYACCGLIKVPKALMYIGPDASYPVKGQLSCLDDIRIIKNSKNWYYVASYCGNGWVAPENIEII